MIFNPNKSLHGKMLVKMVYKNKSGHEMICCKLTHFNQHSSISKVNRVHSLFFQIKKKSCLTFKNVENVGATELNKVDNGNHFKNGDKGQKILTKN